MIYVFSQAVIATCDHAFSDVLYLKYSFWQFNYLIFNLCPCVTQRVN